MHVTYLLLLTLAKLQHVLCTDILYFPSPPLPSLPLPSPPLPSPLFPTLLISSPTLPLPPLPVLPIGTRPSRCGSVMAVAWVRAHPLHVFVVYISSRYRNAQWTQTKVGNYSPLLFLCSTDELSDDEAMVSQSVPVSFPPFLPFLPPSLLSSSPSAFTSTPLTAFTCSCAPLHSHPSLTSLLLSSPSHHLTLVLTSSRIFTHTHPHTFTLLPHTHILSPSPSPSPSHTLTHILTFTLTFTHPHSYPHLHPHTHSYPHIHPHTHTHILILSHPHSTLRMSLMAMTMN